MCDHLEFTCDMQRQPPRVSAGASGNLVNQSSCWELDGRTNGKESWELDRRTNGKKSWELDGRTNGKEPCCDGVESLKVFPMADASGLQETSDYSSISSHSSARAAEKLSQERSDEDGSSVRPAQDSALPGCDCGLSDNDSKNEEEDNDDDDDVEEDLGEKCNLLNVKSTDGMSDAAKTDDQKSGYRVQFGAKEKEFVYEEKTSSAELESGVSLDRGSLAANLSESCDSALYGKGQKRTRSVTSLDSDSSSTSSSSVTHLERRAPDGGWGWVVVVASFLVHCIADGITMSFGILFVELLRYFKESRSVTSWVGSLFMAVPLLAGPLASLLTDRYGCMLVTIWGSIIASFGFFISAFIDSMYLLFLTMGLITGLGLAVCYVAAIVIVAFYFEKRRSLATGMAVAGSGIGTFLFAPLIQYFIEEWGWRGSLIILAGFFLNIAVCGSLMRDLEWTPSSDPKKVSSFIPSVENNRSLSSSHSNSSLEKNVPAVPSVQFLRHLIQSEDINNVISVEDPNLEGIRNSTSLILLPTFIDRTCAIPPDVFPCLSSRVNAYEVVSKLYPHLLSSSVPTNLPHHEEDFKCNGNNNNFNADSPLTTCAGSVIANKEDISTHLTNHCANNTWRFPVRYPKEIDHYRNSKLDPMIEHKFRRKSAVCLWEGNPAPVAPLRNLRVNRQSLTFRGAMLNIHRYRLKASSCPNIYRNSIITLAKNKEQVLWSFVDDVSAMVRSCFDSAYCLDVSYILFAFSNFILYMFYDTVYMYLTDYATGVGVSADDSANLISVIGIVNCVGMVVMGYVGDKEWSSPIFMYNASMVICGMSIIAMPFFTGHWLLCTAAATFGFFIAANYALTSVILVELISLETFSKAYGMLLLIQGVANLIGPPIVGFLADTYGGYILPFAVSGLSIIMCGLILNFIPVVRHCNMNTKGFCDEDNK